MGALKLGLIEKDLPELVAAGGMPIQTDYG